MRRSLRGLAGGGVVSGAAPRPRTPRVLVVDDDPTMRLLVGEALEPDGIDVEEAGDGSPGDRRLPARSPTTWCCSTCACRAATASRSARRSARCRRGVDVPIVIMTGLDDLDSIRRAYEVGATDFITKPIPWLVLSHRVRYLLRASAERARAAPQPRAPRERAAPRPHGELAPTTSRRGELEVSAELRAIFGVDGRRRRRPRGVPRARPPGRSRPRRRRPRCVAAPRRADARRPPHRAARRRRARAADPGPARPRRRGAAAAASRARAQDVTDRRRVEEQIRWLAYHDSLTGLGNRMLFRERHRASPWPRSRRSPAPVRRAVPRPRPLQAHQRHLRPHARATACSRASPTGWCASVRETDLVVRPESPPAISRLGGDEFTVLLTEVAGRRATSPRWRGACSRCCSGRSPSAGHEVVITGSIGIAAFPADGDDAETLLRNADAAMYHAKERGRNNFQFYTASMNAVALQRLILETQAARSALERGELEVHYQPKLARGGPPRGRRRGARALDRRGARRGRCRTDFIPIAEETGLIGGARRLRAAAELRGPRALERARPAAGAGLREPLGAAVPRRRGGRDGRAHPRRDGARPALARARDHRVDAAPRREARRRGAAPLRERGVRVAVDDFGTGYSSLALPAHAARWIR